MLLWRELESYTAKLPLIQYCIFVMLGLLTNEPFFQINQRSIFFKLKRWMCFGEVLWFCSTYVLYYHNKLSVRKIRSEIVQLLLVSNFNILNMTWITGIFVN